MTRQEKQPLVEGAENTLRGADRVPAVLQALAKRILHDISFYK